jgi:cysteine desulfurase family protein (TIGR01976 family)
MPVSGYGVQLKGVPFMGLDNEAVQMLRAEFPALRQESDGKPIIFFDGPGGTQVHGSVIEAMKRYFTQANSNSHGGFLFSRRTDEIVLQARTAAMELLNASRPEEIVFGPNMTTLTFRISQAIGDTFSPGGEVVVSRLDHDANISPWTALQRRGVVIRHVDFDPVDCTLDMASLERAMNARTKLVAVGYASNAVGTINDVHRVVELARSVGAWSFIDAVHYAPHGPIDVSELGCDFLVCSAYKFFGPHVGILYGRYSILEALPPLKVMPAGDAPPDKFETGTGNFEGISGTLAAIDYLASLGKRFGTDSALETADISPRRRNLLSGMNAVQAYERTLCSRLIEGLRPISGIRVSGIVDPTQFHCRVPTVSFTSDRFSPEEIASKLDGKNIFVWHGHFYAVTLVESLGLSDRGGLVRIGLCHYNTMDEVDTLVRALTDLHA